MGNSSTARPVDGRILRSQVTKEAIATAYLDCLERGDLQPKVADVAERAGVSERAVYRKFKQVEALAADVARLQYARVGARVPQPSTADGPLAVRVEAFVARWSAIYGSIEPVRRAALLREPFSDEVRKHHSKMRRARLRELSATFANELEHAGDADRAEILVALSAAVSWTTWDHLTRHLELGAARARAVMERSIRALLAMP